MVTDEWKTRAKEATDQLLALPDSERAAFMDAHDDIWGELKPEMIRLSGHKCWYCETRTDRFDFHVDHYRPKKLVKNKGCTPEVGYWWLTFDYHNFRLACDDCDSSHVESDRTKGKASQFPLASGSLRASSPTSNIDDEVPLLLDPTRPGDPQLLWFHDDGFAWPLWPDGLPYIRAKETIDILNLNNQGTAERRKFLFNKCLRYVNRVKWIFAFYENDTRAAYQEFMHVVQEIQELISPSAEYSAAVRAFLAGLSDEKNEWIKGILV